jgi:hypothetical protein
MNADPAVVESTSLSLKLRRNCTAGEASEPKVAVAMTHFGGTQGPTDVTTLDVVRVLVVTTLTMSVTPAEAVTPPPVPVTVTVVVVAGAVFVTEKVRTETVLPSAGGVTGLLLKAAETPSGNVGTARVTAEWNWLMDCTVMEMLPTPPRLSVSMLGLVDRVKDGLAPAVTVNVALADVPALPSTKIV